MTNDNHAAVYMRVSTDDQNVKAQQESIKRYLRGHGMTIPLDYWYIDEGETGSEMQRPGIYQLEKAIFHGEIHTVVMYSVDRFARTMIDGLVAIDKWQRAGVKMIFVDNTLEVNPHNWMGQAILKVMVAMHLAFAEAHRERILSAQQAGIEAAKAKAKEIIRRREQGENISALATLMNTSESYVRRTLTLHKKRVAKAEKNGEEPPDPPCGWGGRGSGHYKVSLAKLVRLVGQHDLGVIEAARAAGVDRSTVRRRLRDLGGASYVRQHWQDILARL